TSVMLCDSGLKRRARGPDVIAAIRTTKDVKKSAVGHVGHLAATHQASVSKDGPQLAAHGSRRRGACHRAAPRADPLAPPHHEVGRLASASKASFAKCLLN